MNINGSIALVTGANGGIGSAFVTELLKRGAAKVYVAARNPASLATLVATDPRLVPMTLDVTDAGQIAKAVADASDLTLLINNAGYAAFEGAISATDLGAARQEMEVNYFGPLAMTRAFAPVLARAGGGAVLNMLSMVSLVSIPALASYSASKAAILSATRSIRAELAAQGTLVVGVLAVQTETSMGAGLPEPRMTPQEVAVDGIEAVQTGINDDIAAGAQTRGAFQKFWADPKAFQAMVSKLLPKTKPQSV